jgi:hypothetical protein
MNIKRNDIIYVVLLVVVAVLMFVLNTNTPFLHDDFAYHFYYDKHSEMVRPTSIPIISFWEIIPSMWHHYCCVNGRFTSHIILQVFCSLIGKGWLFNLCNTLMFVWLLHLLVRLSSRSLSVPTLSAVICAMCLFLPYPGQTVLWMTGSINYLWTATLSLAILYYIEHNEEPATSMWKCALAIFIGIFVGWMQESITIGVSGALFFWFMKNRSKFRGTNFALTLGFWMGTALILFSPGTFNRIGHGEIATQMDTIQMITSRLFGVIFASMRFVLPLVILVVIPFIWYRGIKNMLLPLLVYTVMVIFLLMLGMQEERMFFGLVIVSIWILMRYCNELWVIKKYVVYYMFSALLLLVLIPTMAKAYTTSKAYDGYMVSITQRVIDASTKAVVETPPFELKSRWVMDLEPVPDKHNFHNRVRGFYYGKESLQYLSPNIYKDYVSNTILKNASVANLIISDDTSRTVYEYNGHWIVCLQEEPKGRLQAVYNIKTNNEPLALHQHILRYLLNSLEAKNQTKNAYTICNDEGVLLFIPKMFGTERVVVTDINRNVVVMLNR